MNRLIVALLAAFDALLAAAGGLAVALAPLTALWVFGFGVGADWGALWPVASTIWQLGHLVPVAVGLPDSYLVATGVDPAAADFTLSLAPLAFTVFTVVFAARSGQRAAAAGDPITGVVAGALVFTAVAVAVAFTGSAEPVAEVAVWQAILFPALVYAVPVITGALIGAWVHDVPPLARLRERADRLSSAWPEVPGLVVRGAGMAVAGLAGLGAIVLAVVVVVRGPQVVALFQAGNVDVIGAIVLAVAQLLYLPTLIVWAVSFLAGPGFVLGTGGAVSPAGTQTGVVPGIPVLGLIPESISPWMLLLALLPVAVGVGTGWMLRSRLVAANVGEELLPRLVVTVAVSVAAAGVVALAATGASGAIGPGRLADVGPHPGPLALAVGIEIAVGIGILLLSPRRADETEDREPHDGSRALATSPPGALDTAPITGAARLDPPARLTGGTMVADDRTGARERPLEGADADPRDAPAPAGEDTAASATARETPTVSADEQETAPIVGFERGREPRPPAEGPPDAPVD